MARSEWQWPLYWNCFWNYFCIFLLLNNSMNILIYRVVFGICYKHNFNEVNFTWSYFRNTIKSIYWISIYIHIHIFILSPVNQSSKLIHKLIHPLHPCIHGYLPIRIHTNSNMDRMYVVLIKNEFLKHLS